MQPNTTKKEYKNALKKLGLYEEVIEGVVPKTEEELTAFILRFGCGDVYVDEDSAFISVKEKDQIRVNFDNRPEQTFKSLPDAYSGTVLKGKPLSQQIGKARVKGFVII